MAKIGFIGLGTMGGPMAKNLVNGGHSVRGYDITPKLINAHVDNGGLRSSNCEEVAFDSDFLFTMLPTHENVSDAIFGYNGAIGGISSECTVIDMSTIHPFESDKIRQRLSEHKIRMVDAPIGRTSKEAREGKSLFMVGADKTSFVSVKPLFELMGDTIIDCGGPGTGARMKIVNNYMTTVLNLLSAETLTLARALGLDIETSLSVLNQTAAGKGHLSTTYPAKVLKNDISPAFMTDLALKDLLIGNSLAKELTLPLILGSKGKDAYIEAQKNGRGRDDWTSIFLELLHKAKLDLK